MSFKVHNATLSASLNGDIETPELRLAIALIFDSIESAPQDETSVLWLRYISPKALGVLSDSGFEIFAQRLEDVVEDTLGGIDVPALSSWRPPGSLSCESCGRWHLPRPSAPGRSVRYPKTCGRPKCVGEYRSRRQREGHSAWKEKNYIDRVCPICSESFRVRPHEGNPESKHYRHSCGAEDCRRGLISRAHIANARERRNRTGEPQPVPDDAGE